MPGAFEVKKPNKKTKEIPLATTDRQGNIRTFCICKERYAIHCSICRDKFAKGALRQAKEKLDKYSFLDRDDNRVWRFYEEEWNRIWKELLK